ncbi:putative F-box protein [Tanacetum coccineum]
MSDYIPLEIQTEIIKRLPIKSLIQFRSVLKQWKSLIDSSQLIAEYQQNTRLQQHLLNPTIRKSVDAVVSRPFDGRFDNDNVGFGVCPHTLEPMLVKIPTEYPIKNLDNTTWVVDVFRLSSGVWKSLCVDLPWSITSTCSQVVIDKFIYWHAFERISGYDLIKSFDMISEEFTKIRLPDSLSSSGNDETDMGMYICKLEESLVVLQFDETDFMAILAYG